MDEDQVKRFEKLEEKLRCLENIALSGSKPNEGREGIEENLKRSERRADSTGLLVAGAATGKPVERIEQELPDAASIWSAKISNRNPGQASLSHQVLCGESSPRWNPPIEPNTPRATAQLSVREAQALRECRERLDGLAQDTIGETLRQLRSLADELMPVLHVDMQKSLERSADALVLRAAHSIERQIQIATGCSVDVALQRMKFGVARAAGETITQENKGGGSAEDGGGGEGEIVRTLIPIVEEIQIKSAAFFDDLHRLLQNTFRAFEEKAIKQIDEEFRKIGEELLRREVGRHLPLGEAREKPDGKIQPPRGGLAIEEQKTSLECAVRNQPIGFGATGSAGPSSGPKPREINHDGSQRPDGGKPRTNAPRWRILGLGGQLLSAVLALF